jgi:hypothetical protein
LTFVDIHPGSAQMGLIILWSQVRSLPGPPRRCSSEVMFVVGVLIGSGLTAIESYCRGVWVGPLTSEVVDGDGVRGEGSICRRAPDGRWAGLLVFEDDRQSSKPIVSTPPARDTSSGSVCTSSRCSGSGHWQKCQQPMCSGSSTSSGQRGCPCSVQCIHATLRTATGWGLIAGNVAELTGPVTVRRRQV